MKALFILFTTLFLNSVFAYEIPIKDSICYKPAVANLETWFTNNGLPYKAVLAEKRADYEFVSQDKTYPLLSLIGIDVVLKPYYTEKVIYVNLDSKPESAIFYIAQMKASNDGECTLMQVTSEK